MSELKEWSLHYAKHRQIARGRQFEVAMGANGFDFVISSSSAKEGYISTDDLSAVKLVTSAGVDTVIVAKNSLRNIDALCTRWNEFVAHEKVRIVFCNQNSKQESTWVIQPYIHNMVADNSKLKTGILSMAGMVDFA